MVKIKKKVKIFAITLALIGLLLISSCFIFIYLSGPVDSSSDAVVEVNIESGSSVSEIASTLKSRGLIKNELIFKLIAKFHTTETLKATVYELKKNMSTDEIVRVLTEGNSYNPDSVRITFNEGETVKKYAKKIANSTNNTYEDVMNKINDITYINTLISKYWFLTEDIKNQDIKGLL